MRRLKFNAQLYCLFGVLLLTLILMFSFLVTGRVDQLAQTQTLGRLEQYVQTFSTEWSKGHQIEIEENDFKAATIQGVIEYVNGKVVAKNITTSQNITDYIPSEKVDSLISKINLYANGEGKGTVKISNGKMFYSFKSESVDTEDGEVNFCVVLTNQSLVQQFRRGITMQIIFIFIVVNLFAFMVLSFWSSNYVSRTKRIQHHISNLKKTNYKAEYADSGKDELADLSRSIEQLRLEILNHETTKQEMLQNISHDFKTPIAVIKSYAEAICDGMATKEDAQIIVNQANLLSYKVAKLIQYNKLEYLDKNKEFEYCSIKEIVNQVVNSYRYQSENIEFVLDLDNSKFKGYSENFFTVIENIVDNAIRYAKSRISISLKNGILKIYNDGKPIDDIFIKEGFKAYEKGSDGQFGLGMSIVKKTLDFFDYEVLVQNLEVGVEFTIKKKKVEIVYKY